MGKQAKYNIKQFKEVLGKRLEKDVQKRVIEYLNMRGHIWGRVNTTGLCDSRGVWRKNPQLFKGLPDILVFKKKEVLCSVHWWAYAIEIKREKGGILSNHQKQFREWWTKSHNIYVVARSVKDLQDAGL